MRIWPDDTERCWDCGHRLGECECPHDCTADDADPLALLDAETDRANRDHYHAEAVKAFASGVVLWGCYFLDAADFYAEPTEAQARERVVMLMGAIGSAGRRTERAEL